MVSNAWEKLFCSYESVFELARGLRDPQNRINNKDLGLLVKKQAESICKANIWSSFLCVLTLASLIKIFIEGKDVTVTNALSCYRQVSIKKQIIFH